MTYRELPEDGKIPDPIITHDAPSRVWHWANFFCMIALCVTGYLIGAPLPAVGGEASSHFLMGNIRFIHFAVGEVFSVLFIFRFYWAFKAGGYSRQMFLPSFWEKTWRQGFFKQIKWNMLLLPKAPRYVGLNPLGALAVLVMFVLPAIITIFTGFAMLGEAAGHESLLRQVMNFMFVLFPNSMEFHFLHRICMWIMVLFAIIHIYIAVHDDMHSRQTLISSMLSGERLFRR